jgi:DNA-binding response OmpR family regulator
MNATPLHSRPILLVEDDPTFSSLVERHLRGHGYTVAVAGSVAEASQWLGRAVATSELPGLVLLDINLPDEAGWALLRGDAIAAAGSPPVVVVTATTLSPRRLREYGVAGCLPKPFAMETLRSTIDRLMPPEDPR